MFSGENVLASMLELFFLSRFIVFSKQNHRNRKILYSMHVLLEKQMISQKTIQYCFEDKTLSFKALYFVVYAFGHLRKTFSSLPVETIEWNY